MPPIGFEEFVEDVRADDHGTRHLDADAREFALQVRARQQSIHKRQPARLAAQRAAADTGETAAGVETLPRKVLDHAATVGTQRIIAIAYQVMPQILVVDELGVLSRANVASSYSVGRSQLDGCAARDSILGRHAPSTCGRAQIERPTDLLPLGIRKTKSEPKFSSMNSRVFQQRGQHCAGTAPMDSARRLADRDARAGISG